MQIKVKHNIIYFTYYILPIYHYVIIYVLFNFFNFLGIVYVQLEGACVTCAQSEVTLQYMIKNMLTYYISEIKEIKNVSKDGIIL